MHASTCNCALVSILTTNYLNAARLAWQLASLQLEKVSTNTLPVKSAKVVFSFSFSLCRTSLKLKNSKSLFLNLSLVSRTSDIAITPSDSVLLQYSLEELGISSIFLGYLTFTKINDMYEIFEICTLGK